jgi:cytochrome P450
MASCCKCVVEPLGSRHKAFLVLSLCVLSVSLCCFCSPFLLHRDPARWEDPVSFKPERWLQFQQQQQSYHQEQGQQPMTPTSNSSTSTSTGGSSSSTSSYSFMSVLKGMGPNGAYIPFGGGPRNCIGTGFAMMEALLVLSALLQRFEVEPLHPGAPFPKPKALLTLRPEGVPLRIKRRQQEQQGRRTRQQQQGSHLGCAEEIGAGLAAR